MADGDPLEGQEIGMLNILLAKFWPLAKNGDEKAADRVIRILQLKAAWTGKPSPDDASWRL